MMKAIITLAALAAITGCQSAPTGLAHPVTVPTLPTALQAPARRLPPRSDPTLQGTVRDAIATDRAYNDVASRYNVLLRIYECVRATINSGKVPDRCP